MIRLSAEHEPEIFAASTRFGAILENVVVDPLSGAVDLDDASLTENTRASYPLRFIPNASATGIAGHPRHIVMLTADAFGVLPPISRLSPEQAMYHFLSGYTARVGGTEAGVNEPQATFSACFGAPFLPRKPGVYATMLGELMRRHRVDCWLVNTGWSGGPYGTGERMCLPHTRAMLRAALDGLAGVPMRTHPLFGLAIPTRCPGVPDEVLDPRATWADGAAYDQAARAVAERFAANFPPVRERCRRRREGRGDPRRLRLPEHLARRLLRQRGDRVGCSALGSAVPARPPDRLPFLGDSPPSKPRRKPAGLFFRNPRTQSCAQACSIGEQRGARQGRFPFGKVKPGLACLINWLAKPPSQTDTAGLSRDSAGRAVQQATAPPGVKRKLTTIFCADVVGYSRLMGADEHGTLNTQCLPGADAGIHRASPRPGGRSGDGALVEFASVVDAVSAPWRSSAPWPGATSTCRRTSGSGSGSGSTSAT